MMVERESPASSAAFPCEVRSISYHLMAAVRRSSRPNSSGELQRAEKALSGRYSVSGFGIAFDSPLGEERRSIPIKIIRALEGGVHPSESSSPEFSLPDPTSKPSCRVYSSESSRRLERMLLVVIRTEPKGDKGGRPESMFYKPFSL